MKRAYQQPVWTQTEPTIPDNLLIAIDPCFEDAAEYSPEKALVTAILERAIRDAAGDPRPHLGIICPKRTALDWLHITEGLKNVDLINPPEFSFVWVAMALDIEPAYLSKRIKRAITLMEVQRVCKRRIKCKN